LTALEAASDNNDGNQQPVITPSTSKGTLVDSEEHEVSDVIQQADCREQLFRDEVDRRLRKAATLMATADQMAPFDKRRFNAALLIW
jgi:hypothetical protein